MIVRGSRGARTALLAGLVAGSVTASIAVAVAPAASAASPFDSVAQERLVRKCERRANDTYRKLLECVSLEGVRRHQAGLQQAADRSRDPVYPGTRAAGTDGYARSVTYVTRQLEAVGYEVTLDEFEFQFAFPAVLRQLTPAVAEYETGAFTGNGSGTVEGTVVPVDVSLELPRASTSACEDEDFAGLDLSGDADIALVQRGTCTFGAKALNAQEAGAEAVILFNQGNDPTREDLIVGTLIPDGAAVTIPVVGASFAQGVALAAPGSTAFVEVIPNETRTSVNVLAELPGETDDNVVMLGGHLDSVSAGPGIQDDGSGVGAVLETAIQMANVEPENTVRFAFWGAEELGLIGSTDYVENLPAEELDRIALYLNFDMIGSPNYIQTVYDADQSTFEAPEGITIPQGSTAIENLFEGYYTLVGEPYDDSEFSGRSDYQAFIENGIPSGGLFTGAEGVKTEAQAAIWGGTVGDQYDPCYHLACDTYDNISLEALDVNSDQVAFAALTYAYSTATVNGVPGRRVPGPRLILPVPAGEQGTFALTDGGDEHDHEGEPE